MALCVRTGIDIVHIPRIARMLDQYGARFVTRIYTPSEIHTCAGQAHAFAARWAAKEAVAKLLGVGIAGLGSGPAAVSFCHIEVIRTQSGKPTVMLHQRAQSIAQRLCLSSMDISMSHDGEYAVASVVALAQALDESTP
ncbi:MAG: holo-ACP synthase [Roseiflexaceae bacterium]